ncbi:MAG: hypothetical protein GWN58_31820 [Anaerolineae bacterium]|nr:hypothetical protein [Anaerolineae bacterium]
MLIVATVLLLLVGVAIIGMVVLSSTEQERLLQAEERRVRHDCLRLLEDCYALQSRWDALLAQYHELDQQCEQVLAAHRAK